MTQQEHDFFDWKNWKNQLRKLEKAEEFRAAIMLMDGVIKYYPKDVDARISLNYLTMRSLFGHFSWSGKIVLTREEKVDFLYHQTYTEQFQRDAITYFRAAQEKFQEDAKYLYCTALIAEMSPWYFGIDPFDKDYLLDMKAKAYHLEPDNFLYQGYYYNSLDDTIPENREKIVAYCKKLISDTSPLKDIFKDMGSFGEYFLWVLTNSWGEYLARLENVR